MHTPLPPGKRVVFRPWITRKGVRVYAKWYGLKAFPIVIDD